MMYNNNDDDEFRVGIRGGGGRGGGGGGGKNCPFTMSDHPGGCRATTRRPLAFNHQVSESSWYLFIRPCKTKRLSKLWIHQNSQCDILRP